MYNYQFRSLPSEKRRKTCVSSKILKTVKTFNFFSVLLCDKALCDDDSISMESLSEKSTKVFISNCNLTEKNCIH